MQLWLALIWLALTCIQGERYKRYSWCVNFRHLFITIPSVIAEVLIFATIFNLDRIWRFIHYDL
jgi:hypothetical protein